MKEPMGPSVRRLWIELAAVEAVPAEAPNGLAAGIQALIGLQNKHDNFMPRARAKLEAALAAVKAAPDNKWGDDEEAIAAEILRHVDEKKARRLAELRGKALP